MQSKVLPQLAPASDFIAGTKDIVGLVDHMKTFNSGLDFNQNINLLSGKAKTIAQQIQSDLVPQFTGLGLQVYNAIAYTVRDIQNLSDSMVNVMKVVKSGPANVIKTYVGIAKGHADNTVNDLNNKITPSLDTYQGKVNDLISKLNSEKLAIKENEEALKKQRDQIIKEMNDREHPKNFCGKVKKWWDEMTGKLNDELNQDREQLAQVDFQYNCNSLALGGANNMIGTLKSYADQLQTQTHYWDSLSSFLSSLQMDMQMLLDERDKSFWADEAEMVTSDWEAVKKML